GHFSLDGNGQIVNNDGYALQGDGGAITITPDDQNVHVGVDGTISSTVNGLSSQVAKLQVVDFADPRALVKQGGNLYSPSQAPITAAGATVGQGMLESSNVQAVLEISHML